MPKYLYPIPFTKEIIQESKYTAFINDVLTLYNQNKLGFYFEKNEENHEFFDSVTSYIVKYNNYEMDLLEKTLTEYKLTTPVGRTRKIEYFISPTEVNLPFINNILKYYPKATLRCSYPSNRIYI